MVRPPRFAGLVVSGICALGGLPQPVAAQQGTGSAPPPGAPPRASFSAEPRSGPAPLVVQFTDRSYGEVTSWSWDFGDGGSSSQQHPLHTYEVGGRYPVTLTVLGPWGSDRLTRPEAIAVTSCNAGNARANRSFPLELGQDFVPITGDDALGFYAVYSARTTGGSSQVISNNVGLFVLPLDAGEVLLFGSGYGDRTDSVPALRSAAYDIDRVDQVIRWCLGLSPATTTLHFVAPHGHVDHINPAVMRELRSRGYTIGDIYFHEADLGLINGLPGWTAADRALFRRLEGPACAPELLSFHSPLGKLWFFLRPGHTNGALDLVIDVQDDPTNRFVVRGSGPSAVCPPLPGQRDGIDPHGNILLAAIAPTLEALSPAAGPARGGTEVVVHGSGFAAPGAGLPRVVFGGVEAGAVQVLDDATLLCTTPPGPPDAQVALDVITRNGAARLGAAFHYRPPPILDGLSPAQGAASGGSQVTLTGSGFLAGPGTTRVLFGGRQASSVQVLDDGTLTCTSPPGIAGLSADVELENENGSTRLAAAFTFLAVLDVTGVSPGAGTSLGGTRVTISGGGFSGALDVPSVSFGGRAAGAVVVVDDSRIICDAPAGTPATQVAVSVSASTGTDAQSQAYRYFPTPRLNSVSPASGPAGGGTSILLSGANFTRNSAGPCTVLVGGLAATNVVALDDTRLQCLTPANLAGVQPVVVSNANGSATLALGFTYYEPPTVTGLVPAQGSALGATPVTVSGSGFLANGAGLPTVSLGGTLAADVQVLSDASLTCTVPAGTPGAVLDLVLSNANGAALLAGAFRYHPSPVLNEVFPASGPASGRTRVVLRGSGFQANAPGMPSVFFGARPARNIVVLDDRRVTCDTPSGTPGPTSVYIGNANGSALLENAFTYGGLPPTLSSLAPSSGPSQGGTAVTVTGTGFLNDDAGTNTVTFGGAVASSVVVLSDTTLTCQAPPGAPGSLVALQVTNARGTATLNGAYRYHLQPTLGTLAPSSCSASGGVPAMLTGSGFLADQAGVNVLLFGGNPASDVRVLDDSSLTCLLPAGQAGTVADLTLSNANGSALLTGALRYHASPTLTGIAPDAGTALGGRTVTLSGTGFLADDAGPCSVAFDGAAAGSVTVSADDRLTCLTPPGSAGSSVEVRVANRNGSAALPAGYQYHPAPTLGSVSPDHGPAGGATLLTLYGSGFQGNLPGANRVTIGGIVVTGVTVLDDTRLRCSSPAGVPGKRVDVQVSNDNGSAQLVQGFRYHAAPELSGIDPPGGSALGSALVTLTGSGFAVDQAGASTILFAGAPASAVTVLDDTRVRCRVPAGSAGTLADVTLGNANGSVTRPGLFEYFPLPTLSGLDPAHGFSGGSSLVLLQGSGFLANSAGTNLVSFGGASATGVVALDDAILQCSTPPGSAGPVEVRVSNANGEALLADAFHYDWAPTVTGCEPSSGSSLGGGEVLVHGGGFAAPGAGPLVVRFGANLASDVRALDGGALLCTVPPGPAGDTVLVEVANERGSSGWNGYRYHPLPTVASVDPPRGAPEGGTRVTVGGSGFVANGAGLPAVLFGGNQATEIVVLDDATLECTAPAGTPRSSAPVRVENRNGAAELPAGYRWHPRVAHDLNDDGYADLVLGALDAVFVFFGGPAAPQDGNTSGAQVTLRPSTAGTDFGSQLACGDIDGDGRSDLVIGASLDDQGGLDAGAVFVFLGPLAAAPAARYSSSAEAMLRGEQAGDRFGSSLAIGDLTGDGSADLAVGAFLSDVSASDAGSAYVFRGRSPFPGGSATTALARFTGQASRDWLGAALAIADVTGSDTQDLILGAPQNDGAGGNSGRVYVFPGSTSLGGAGAGSAPVRITGARSGDRLGSAVAGGDFSGDGRDDLALGAPEADEGAIFVVLGGATLATGSAEDAPAIFTGERSGDRLGQGLALGDADGDGIADLLAGAPLHDLPAASCGRAYLFRGGTLGVRTGSSAASILTAENSAGDQFGAAVSLLDLDGDGRDELVVGAPFSNGAGSDSGRVYAFRGSMLQPTRSAGADDGTITGSSLAGTLGKALAAGR